MVTTNTSFLGWLPMILIPLALICAMFGVYFVLKAIWTLRTGENERLFVRRGLIGIALIVVPWFVLWLGVAGVATAVSSASVSSAAGQTQPGSITTQIP